MHAKRNALRWSIGLASVLAASGAARAQIDIEYSALPSQVAPEIVIDGVTVTAESGGAPANVVLLNGDGLGVEGGASDAMNLNERLIFTFDGFCAGDVAYRTHDADDGDCDGRFGESQIIATDLTGEDYPPYPVFGRAGNANQYVTRAVDGAPVTGFEVRSNSTQIWIWSLRADQLGEVELIDFTTMGTFSDSSLTVGDVEIAAEDADGLPGTLTVHSGFGLAVEGGTQGVNPDFRVSDFETLVFEFTGQKPDAVSVVYDRLNDGDHGDDDGDGLWGESFVVPIDASTNLGYLEGFLHLLDWEDPAPFSINAAVGGAPFDKFRLSTNYYHPTCPTDGNGDSFRVEKIAYCLPASEDCYADCNGDGVLNILDFVCYQNDFNAGCP